MSNRLKIADNWTPNDLSLTLWLDASDSQSLIENPLITNNLNEWRDKSGNDIHLFQTESINQPATNVKTINGLNAVFFDGDKNDPITPRRKFLRRYFSINEFTPLGYAGQQFAPEIFIFSVGRTEKVVAGTLFIGGVRFLTHVPWSNGRIFFDVGTNIVSDPDDQRVYTNPLIQQGDSWLVGFQSSHTVNTYGQSIYFNGELAPGPLGQSTVNIPFAKDITPADDIIGSFESSNYRFTLGGYSAPGDSLNVSVGEFIVYQGQMTTNLRQKFEGYLAHKWGITNLLSNNHPYKKFPPNKDNRLSINNSNRLIIN